MLRKNVIVILPSSLHEFMFCPRRWFFNHVFREKPPLIVRIRMLIGKIRHFLFELMHREYERERLLEVVVEELGEPSVVLRGRPDLFRVRDGEAEVIEYKSYRAPPHGHPAAVCWEHGCVWRSDYAQLLCYCYIVEKLYKPSDIKAVVVYRNDGSLRAVRIVYDKVVLLNMLRWYRNAVLAEALLDPVYRSDNMCRRCQYRELCRVVDEELGVEKQ